MFERHDGMQLDRSFDRKKVDCVLYERRKEGEQLFKNTQHFYKYIRFTANNKYFQNMLIYITA